MYTFNIAVSATIEKEAVEAILKDYLEKEAGRKVKSIEFNLAEISDFADRYSHKAFSGCTVRFEDDEKTVGIPAHDNFSKGGFR